MAVKNSTDPFLVDPKADDPNHSFDVPLASDPHIIEQDPQGTLATSPAPKATQEDEPTEESYDIDGGTVTIKYDKKKGWTGILSLDDGGGDEVFQGKTQKELMTKVLAGKAKATAQIRKLNKKIKLGVPVEEPVVPQETYPTAKALDANDIFEIKTAADVDLDKAMGLRFKKKYGMSEEEFITLVHQIRSKADKGEEAYEELSVEQVSKEFLEAHKDEYYPYAENGDSIMAWLCRHKLRRNVKTTDNFGTISGELLKKGLYTVENLEEAFEDLRDSGLLISPPVEETDTEPEPEPAPQAPPASQNSRIASTRRQPRGGLGIRASSVVTRPNDEPRAPSVDELENLSDAEVSRLLTATRQYARSTQRR